MENTQIANDEDRGKYQIDNLDRRILQALIEDARTPFSELAERLGVSGGTIHLRYGKLREAGIILGSRLVVAPKKIGLGISSLIGIRLTSAREFHRVVEKLTPLSAIVQASSTTGPYNIIVRVFVDSIESLNQFLRQQLQPIEGIQSTETLVVLEEVLERPITIVPV